MRGIRFKMHILALRINLSYRNNMHVNNLENCAVSDVVDSLPSSVFSLSAQPRTCGEPHPQVSDKVG